MWSVSPSRAVSLALTIPVLPGLSQLAVLCLADPCQRWNRLLQLRPCSFGVRAEVALHTSACYTPVYSCQYGVFSKTFLTLKQFVVFFYVAAITTDVSHLAFVRLMITTYRSLSFWFTSFFFLSLFFLFLFLPFQSVFPWSFSILTETSSNFIAVLPSLTSFVNSMSSVYAFSQIKTVRSTSTRTSIHHKVKLVITSLHFDNYPPNKFIESIYPFG